MSPQSDLVKLLANAAARISAAQTLADLERVLIEATGRLGFDTYNLAVHQSSARAFMETPTLTSWRLQDLVDYDRDRWFERDPLLRRAAGEGPAFLWSPADIATWGNAEYQKYVASVGITGGVTVPLGHEGGHLSALTMLSFRGLPQRSEVAQAAYVLGTLLSSRAVALGVAPRLNDNALRLRDLSGHQREVLKWIAAGKTSREIAVIIGISQRTVDYHVAEMLRKLNVVNRAQAASIYIGR